MAVDLEEPYILVTDQKISTIQDILPLLEQVIKENKPLLLIADDIENEVTSTLIVNKLRGTFNVVATKAPGFGDHQKEMLNDIAVLTGATFIAKDLQMKLTETKIENLGVVHKAVVKKDSTTLIGGHGHKDTIEERIMEIEAQIKLATSDYDKKRYKERLAKLSGGVAIIKVGATTETELKEKKLRIEDALNATRAAITEGIVIGGGAVLIDIQKELKQTLKDDHIDRQRGILAVLDSLSIPLYQIAENAGFDGQDILEHQKKQKEDYGFDAKEGKWTDMLKAGIIDPTKVTKNAILNAASISALIITSEAAVVEIKEKENQPQMPSMY
jgi:chaperonin GroEL